MDKDRVKGAVDDTVGRAKRQVGEWTDNPNLQGVEGAAQQVKGKAEKVVGNVKDAAREAGNEMKKGAREADERNRQQNEIDRKQNPGNFVPQDQGRGAERHKEGTKGVANQAGAATGLQHIFHSCAMNRKAFRVSGGLFFGLRLRDGLKVFLRAA